MSEDLKRLLDLLDKIATHTNLSQLRDEMYNFRGNYVPPVADSRVMRNRKTGYLEQMQYAIENINGSNREPRVNRKSIIP